MKSVNLMQWRCGNHGGKNPGSHKRKRNSPFRKDSYLLDAVKKAGFTVPTLCHHKDLTPTGTCRLCMCEIEIRGRKKLVTACNYPIRQPITVWTESEPVIGSPETPGGDVPRALAQCSGHTVYR